MECATKSLLRRQKGRKAPPSVRIGRTAGPFTCGFLHYARWRSVGLVFCTSFVNQPSGAAFRETFASIPISAAAEVADSRP